MQDAPHPADCAGRNRSFSSPASHHKKGGPTNVAPPFFVTTYSVTPDSFRGPSCRESNTVEFAAPWMPDQARHDEGEAYAVTASAFGLIFPVAIAVSLSSVAYSSSSVSLRIAAISGRPSWFAQAIIVP